MNGLNPSTRRRLLELPQIQSVWEGDRRSFSQDSASDTPWSDPTLAKPPADGECILWVDGSQGMVRSMDVVPLETGHEAIVRTLLRAMEHPHNPAKPARPQKIVVRDRETLFYLRGVLQDLDITLDYVPDLPLIDEIFRGFQETSNSRPPSLPPEHAEELIERAEELWNDAPWEVLADHQILELEINRWDLKSVYASVMGMLGMEYGVLLYRSLDSLRQFRERVLSQDSIEHMEEAFLGQDCLFLTYETEGDDEEFDQDFDLAEFAEPELKPVFGNLHPLEGIRSFLYDEEAIAFSTILEAMHRFLKQHRRKLEGDNFPEISSRYKISADGASVSIKVTTLPDVADELFSLVDEADDEIDMPVIRDDLVPENAFLSLGVIPWDMVERMRSQLDHYQPGEPAEAGEGLPVILIQTSRPKAKSMIETIESAGGIRGICFNPGADPFMGDHYDLGLFQTQNGELHLFGEFGEDDPTHVQARKKWEQRCKKTKGYCGLVIAKGLTGASRGNPNLKDMMALFEVAAISSDELGLGTLERKLAVDGLG
ncbi:MAG: hypothetical protein KME43_12065 [Myxacorys chilensis ATA2-1-KO14]|jgi:hypothetical protein|nr:hypothetical protein [Myxacorys chilensis ATA2-1-KO14]